jgi:hypothetical protein
MGAERSYGEMIASGEIKPQHKICETSVEAPTISVTNIGPEGEEVPTVCVQWFGETRHALPKKPQFLFSVLSKPDAIQWMGHPELFKVAFLGQVKDWPNPSVAQAVADLMTDGDLKGWVIYLCSHHYHQQYPQGTGPGSFAMAIALLGDPNVGVITPQSFTNLDVLKCLECKRS